MLVHSTDLHRLQALTFTGYNRLPLWPAAHSLRMFDALFVQAALERGIPLLTADRRLCQAAAGLVPTQLLRGISTR